MRIAVISTPIFKLPCIGYAGLEHLAWQHAVGLAKLGHQVSLIAPEGSTADGVQVIGIPYVNGNQRMGEEQAYGGIKGTSWGGYWQHLLQCDVVLDHTWEKRSALLKMEIRNGRPVLDKPILAVCHAPVDMMYRELPPPGVLQFVCISEDQGAHFRALYNRDCRVARNCVDTEFYKPLDTPRSDRFLFLARFSSIKGADIALESCKKAGAGLDLIGDTQITQEPDYIRKCVEMADGKQLRIIGNQPRGNCVWWYSQAHCMLHPNLRFREPLGLAPLESQACFPADTPVRATAIQRTFSLTYTGKLLQLSTDCGIVECTPEHPFMTQRGWIAAKDLTLVDSLVRVCYGRCRVDERRIGDFVRQLSAQRRQASSRIAESIYKFGEIKGEETWIGAAGLEAVYRGRRKDYSRSISGERFRKSGRVVATAQNQYPQESLLYGTAVQIRFGRLYRGGNEADTKRVSRDGTGGCRQSDWANTGECSGESQNYEGRTAPEIPCTSSCCCDDTGRVGLFGRANRRRGEHWLGKRVQEKKSGAYDTDSQYIGTSDRLDYEQVAFSERSRRSASRDSGAGFLQRKKTQFLGNIISGLQIPVDLRGAFEVFGYQKTANGVGYRMVENSFGSDEDGGNNSKGKIACEDAPFYEFARLRSITGREVQDLPVFNLGTGSGTYEAAGYLVHNCGCPVAAFDNGAMRETVKDGETGWVCKTLGEFETAVGNVKTVGIPDNMRKRCREWVCDQWSLQKMILRYNELVMEVLDAPW